jgi:hypothetical protein
MDTYPKGLVDSCSFLFLKEQIKGITIDIQHPAVFDERFPVMQGWARDGC